MKRLLFLIALTSAIAATAKERLSYLYIQGDKQTPFYVKLEEAMQPRFGKNYCIIPQLAPGPAHIEVLFQQNAFPPQQFTVLIPEGGSRGFLLVRKDSAFSLYDLQQGFYLPAGNAQEDDKLPQAGGANVAIASPAEVSEPHPQKSVAQTEKKGSGGKTRRSTASKPDKPVADLPARPANNGQPSFIPEIELVNGREGEQAPQTQKPALPVITNSDCPAAVSTAEFGKLFNSMSGNTGDEDRLAFVMTRLDVCYESWQARALAGMLSTDAARFILLKKIYPRITDQSAFTLLDDLFTAETWKAEFAKLVRR